MTKKRASTKPGRKKAARSKRGVTEAAVRRHCLRLPGVDEGPSYGTAAWRVKGKLFARMHQGGEDVVVRVDLDEREFLMQANPAAFHITDHYANSAMMLVRMAAVNDAEMGEMLVASWRRCAPTRLLASFDEAGTGGSP